MTVHTKDMVKCPKHIPVKEWVYACERAARAKKYAQMFGLTKSCEAVFSEAGWQWENEVRGRFTSPVGGSLSGTRSGGS